MNVRRLAPLVVAGLLAAGGAAAAVTPTATPTKTSASTLSSTAAHPERRAGGPESRETPTAPPNPLLTEWKTPFGVPPFGDIREEHFLPALEEGMAAERREIAAITGRGEAPTFENTIVALDQAGELLGRVQAVFGTLTGADTNDALQAINREVSPLLTAHRDDVSLDEQLFLRVKAVWAARETLGLEVDQRMLLDRTYQGFAG